MAELKEEHIISHTSTATQLHTAAAGVSSDTSRPLSEYIKRCMVVHVAVMKLGSNMH